MVKFQKGLFTVYIVYTLLMTKSGKRNIPIINLYITFYLCLPTVCDVYLLLLSRSLTITGKWKMREHHVFFMYFLYHILAPESSRLVFGVELLAAVKHLLLAMHLVKGFSPEVRSSLSILLLDL